MQKRRILALLMAFAMTASLALTGCGSQSETDETTTEAATSAAKETTTEETSGEESISADDAIESVFGIGYMDYDGAKLQAIAVEYSVDLAGADISADDFEISDYAMENSEDVEVGDAADAGQILKAYINDEAEVSESGGSGSGNYVIIEVNTDYVMSSSTTYNKQMIFSVKQTGTINASAAKISPQTEEIVNYETEESTTMAGDVKIEKTAYSDTFSVSGFEAYEIHPVDGTGDLAPFEATNCFEEATGEYMDVTVPYSIYVPEDYDESKEYALIVFIGSAGCTSNDTTITLTESMTASNLTQDKWQDYMKEQGLGGLIVLCPQVPENLRSTRDNWTVSAAVPAHWQLLDYLTEQYNISSDRIYGTGHSMGGMQILAMAAQRDNYFAGIWAVGNQWGSNYNKEVEYQDEVYYASPADGELIWTKDADGNDCDYKNWYYMISDDNILISNCAGDAFSSGTWQELAYLYEDICGVTIPRALYDPLETTKEEQEQAIADLTAQESVSGKYWMQFSGGSHTGTWVYSEQNDAGYEWLLKQTREAEQARAKLDLAGDFEFADEQILTEERIYGETQDGETIYYATAKAGSGTGGYNAPVFVKAGKLVCAPGWTPESRAAKEAAKESESE